MLKNKCKKWLGAENNALTDLLYYILEVLSLFEYNTSLLAIYIYSIKNCGNYVQVKVKISEFLPLLLLSLVQRKYLGVNIETHLALYYVRIFLIIAIFYLKNWTLADSA